MTSNSTEDVVIALIPKNKRDRIRVSLAPSGSSYVLSIWPFFTDEYGNLRPCKQGGIVMGIRHLQVIAEALAEAVDVAKKLGWLAID